MILQDLPAGMSVKLEIVWGNNTYNLDSEVIGSNQLGLLIRPFIYNGIIINLSAEKQKDIIFHLHTIDPKTHMRMSWKNITVQSVSYQGRTYYACAVTAFKKNAVNNERREGMRIPLNLPGKIEFPNGLEYAVKIKDISDQGIGFWIAESVEFPSVNGVAKFSDTVRGKHFDVEIPFKKVRTGKGHPEKVIGATTSRLSEDAIAYLFVKKTLHLHPESEEPKTGNAKAGKTKAAETEASSSETSGSENE